MSINFFLKGLLLGFSIAAPVGPIGVLCIQRTLNKGRLSGFISGLGAATADAIYGCIAGFGLTLLSNFLVKQQGYIKIIGGLFLIYLGIKILLSKPAEKAADTRGSSGIFGDYSSTLGLTLTNPMTIISFSAMFAGLGIVNTSGEYTSAVSLVAGVFIGSALWWLTLSNLINLFRKIIANKALIWINRFSGVVVIVFGAIAIISRLMK